MKTKRTDAQRLLEHIARRFKAKRSGSRYRALCPCHADRDPSLVISLNDRSQDGTPQTPDRVLLKCFAGCTEGRDRRARVSGILGAVGLSERELFVSSLGPRRQRRANPETEARRAFAAERVECRGAALMSLLPARTTDIMRSPEVATLYPAKTAAARERAVRRDLDAMRCPVEKTGFPAVAVRLKPDRADTSAAAARGALMVSALANVLSANAQIAPEGPRADTPVPYVTERRENVGPLAPPEVDVSASLGELAELLGGEVTPVTLVTPVTRTQRRDTVTCPLCGSGEVRPFRIGSEVFYPASCGCPGFAIGRVLTWRREAAIAKAAAA